MIEQTDTTTPRTVAEEAEAAVALHVRNLAHAAASNARWIEQEMKAAPPVDFPMAEGHAILLAKLAAEILSTIKEHRPPRGSLTALQPTAGGRGRHRPASGSDTATPRPGPAHTPRSIPVPPTTSRSTTSARG